MPEQTGPAVPGALTGPGAAVGGPVTGGDRAAEEALALRDAALAALDGGDLAAALDAAGRGLAVLEAAGLAGGPSRSCRATRVGSPGPRR